MAKAADYFITGIWFSTVNNSKLISHVLLHTVNENNSFNVGSKNVESAVISLWKRGYKIMTITWDYAAASWQIGAEVLVEKRRSDNREFLRTHENASTRDNLDNLITMQRFPI